MGKWRRKERERGRRVRSEDNDDEEWILDSSSIVSMAIRTLTAKMEALKAIGGRAHYLIKGRSGKILDSSRFASREYLRKLSTAYLCPSLLTYTL